MKKSTFLFFLVFFSGVIIANIFGVASGRDLGAMNEYFMNKYMYADVLGKELFLFLFYERVPKGFLLLLLSIGIFGMLVIKSYICYLYFSAGFLSVVAIMNYGIKGVLLMFGFFLPQWLFYIPVIMIWFYGLQAYKERKRCFKIRYVGAFGLAGLLMVLGLFMESYVNPVVLQNIIRII